MLQPHTPGLNSGPLSGSLSLRRLKCLEASPDETNGQRFNVIRFSAALDGNQPSDFLPRTKEMSYMMEDCSESKIWKYMDLAKFVSLLSTKSLYFACPFQFHDSAEGSLPKSHMEAWSKLLQQSSLDPMLSLRPPFAAQSSDSLQQFDGIIKNLATEMRLARRKATLKFGVSCWQKSEHESEAM